MTTLKVTPALASPVNDGVFGGAFLSSGPGGPPVGDNVYSVTTLPLDYCSPIPVPVPPALVGFLLLFRSSR